jgi:CxxC motif-containing protein (DUF1111 family)
MVISVCLTNSQHSQTVKAPTGTGYCKRTVGLAASVALRAAALFIAVCSGVVVAMPGDDRAGDHALAHDGYSRPLADLDAAEVRSFAAGKEEFAARWVPPFLSGGHWGRGPQSNAESCLACHPGNGRGRAPDGPGEGGSRHRAPMTPVVRSHIRPTARNSTATASSDSSSKKAIFALRTGNAR